MYLRKATRDDLPAINRLIESGIDSWHLPERVKRISKPIYRYDALDFKSLQIRVVETEGAEIVGVAAWENAGAHETPQQGSALLLHGLYVSPLRHNQGIGTRLLNSVIQEARQRSCSGLLVKAQSFARAFFEKRGMNLLEVNDSQRDYPYRYWLSLPQEEACA